MFVINFIIITITIFKSDWLSTVLISGLIGQCNRTTRHAYVIAEQFSITHLHYNVNQTTRSADNIVGISEKGTNNILN